MTKDERIKFNDMHADMTMALEYLTSGRIGLCHTMVRSAYKKVCDLTFGNKKIIESKNLDL